MQADTSGMQTYYLYDPKNGLLQYVLVAWPNGLSTTIQYDTEHQYTWTQAVFQDNAAGQLFELTLSNRDGTLTTDYYHQAWTGDPLYEVQVVANADHSWSHVTDAEWALLAPFLPRPSTCGRPRRLRHHRSSPTRVQGFCKAF